jgi:hypothetical protein
MEMRTCSVSCLSNFSDFFSLSNLLSYLDPNYGKMSVGRKEGLTISLMFDNDNISSISPRLGNDNFSCMACIDGSSSFGNDIYSLVRTDPHISSSKIGTQPKH